jgi:hypothetical protein
MSVTRSLSAVGSGVLYRMIRRYGTGRADIGQPLGVNCACPQNGLCASFACRRGIELEPEAPAQIFEEGYDRIRVYIQVSRMFRPCDVEQTSQDVGQLGVAVRAIAFEPVP